ncbi:hypothetical protein ROZALSC1DRAFT_21091 [Rozella allomycis CSF55]|uniref:Uncharacterized protein n=1 Tax=Rozella allomycis (strain CSF55) TaxID=988480 RepID=A0A4P9YP22_ROZAC|nr:hypothetical protein ROZALSC1DRAFT_21091 [Rozella allomycis CSF55]
MSDYLFGRGRQDCDINEILRFNPNFEYYTSKEFIDREVDPVIALALGKCKSSKESLLKRSQTLYKQLSFESNEGRYDKILNAVDGLTSKVRTKSQLFIFSDDSKQSSVMQSRVDNTVDEEKLAWKVPELIINADDGEIAASTGNFKTIKSLEGSLMQTTMKPPRFTSASSQLDVFSTKTLTEGHSSSTVSKVTEWFMKQRLDDETESVRKSPEITLEEPKADFPMVTLESFVFEDHSKDAERPTSPNTLEILVPGSPHLPVEKGLHRRGSQISMDGRSLLIPRNAEQSPGKNVDRKRSIVSAVTVKLEEIFK